MLSNSSKINAYGDIEEDENSIMTVDETFRKDCISAFGLPKSTEDEILEKLRTLSEIFNVNVEELFVDWESFNVTKVQDNLDLNLENLDRFQEHMQSTIAQRATPAIKKVKDIQGSGIKRKPVIRASPAYPSTPSVKRTKVVGDSPAFETPRGNFVPTSPAEFETANNTFQSSPETKVTVTEKVDDKESHTVIETLNPEKEVSQGYVNLEEDSTTAIKPFKIMANFDPSKYKFRTMSMKLLESADVLDDQIDTMAHLFQESSKENTDGLSFGNPCLSSQFDLLCCGRIVPDSPNYDRQKFTSLNDSTLFLETSRLSGIGQRIPLDLSQLQEYSFFPGQIVVLKGRNPTGRAFVVAESLQLPELGSPVSSSRDIEDFQELVQEAGLKIVVASGPFSNQHTLNYARLNNLVDRVNNETKPHMVLLYGPFVDITNKAVSTGDIEVANEKLQPRNLDEVFKATITPILKKINPRIQVVLIPSVKDASIKHCSYPQDSFDRKRFGLPKNVRIFPNPSSFSINEVLIGSSNLDVFKDLKEVQKVPSSGKLPSNRFERIAGHIFDQRRYYPCFTGSIARQAPSPAESAQSSEAVTTNVTDLHDGMMRDELTETSIGGANLEVPYLGLAELGESLPDILIVPSEMRHFAKVIKGVIVINPGQFVRSHRDASKENGTYVVVSVEPPRLPSDDNGNLEPVENTPSLFYHNVHSRARVDIVKS